MSKICQLGLLLVVIIAILSFGFMPNANKELLTLFASVINCCEEILFQLFFSL